MTDKLEVSNWICDYVGRVLGVPPERIDTGAPFERLGLDSATAVALIGDLEDWLGIELSPVLAYDHPTISRLSEYLAGEARRAPALTR